MSEFHRFGRWGGIYKISGRRRRKQVDIHEKEKQKNDVEKKKGRGGERGEVVAITWVGEAICVDCIQNSTGPLQEVIQGFILLFWFATCCCEES